MVSHGTGSKLPSERADWQKCVCACGVWKKSINKMADTRGHSEGAGSRQSNQNLRSKRKSLVTGAMNGESVEGRYDSESK